MVHQVGEFTVNDSGDGIGQVGVRASERLGGKVEVTYFASITSATTHPNIPLVAPASFTLVSKAHESPSASCLFPFSQGSLCSVAVS